MMLAIYIYPQDIFLLPWDVGWSFDSFHFLVSYLPFHR